jgi:hypothetical protein
MARWMDKLNSSQNSSPSRLLILSSTSSSETSVPGGGNVSRRFAASEARSRSGRASASCSISASFIAPRYKLSRGSAIVFQPFCRTPRRQLRSGAADFFSDNDEDLSALAAAAKQDKARGLGQTRVNFLVNPLSGSAGAGCGTSEALLMAKRLAMRALQTSPAQAGFRGVPAGPGAGFGNSLGGWIKKSPGFCEKSAANPA